MEHCISVCIVCCLGHFELVEGRQFLQCENDVFALVAYAAQLNQ